VSGRVAARGEGDYGTNSAVLGESRKRQTEDGRESLGARESVSYSDSGVISVANIFIAPDLSVDVLSVGNSEYRNPRNKREGGSHGGPGGKG